MPPFCRTSHDNCARPHRSSPSWPPGCLWLSMVWLRLMHGASPTVPVSVHRAPCELSFHNNRRAKAGCGSLRCENPGAFQNAEPSLPDPSSRNVPKAQALARAACHDPEMRGKDTAHNVKFFRGSASRASVVVLQSRPFLQMPSKIVFVRPQKWVSAKALLLKHDNRCQGFSGP